MAMPSRDLGDFLVAHWAESVLFLPEIEELSFSGQVPFHFYVKTFFKVQFPGRIKRVGCSMNRSMPLDLHIACSSQVNELRVSFLVFDFTCKHPVLAPFCREVFLPYPGCAFSWVSPPGPPPQLFKDSMPHGVEGFATRTKSVIVRPPPYDRVQLHYDLSGRAILVFFDNP